jgi:hypothetical protein
MSTEEISAMGKRAQKYLSENRFFSQLAREYEILF